MIDNTSKTKEFLDVVNAMEAFNEGFFSRNGSDATVWIHSQDQTGMQWRNARKIEAQLFSAGVLNFGPEIDRQSGNLLIRVPNIYKG